MAQLTSILSLFLSLHATLATANKPKPIEIIRDVAIIGGGASGTYAAVRLREDLNKTVVLIESMPNLGGHTNTYHIPGSNLTIDYGVQSYLPYGPASSFFARFGIATEIFAADRLTPLNVDVETGKVLGNYQAPSANATNEAFARWLAITSKYRNYLEPGYWNFPLPQDIPEDFLLPFEQFAKREKIEDAVPRIVAISGVGYGGVRDLLTLTVLQAFGASLTEDFLNRTLFRPTGQNNGLLYERALHLLQPDVLLSSTVQSTKHTSNGIQLTVKQANNTVYTIKAKHVLFTAPPSLKNLSPFHPDKKQTSVLAPWVPSGEFVGILHAPCLPEKYSITYLPTSVVPAQQLAIKDWPYSLRLDSTGPSGAGLFRVIFGANYTLSVDGFKALVLDKVKEVVENAGLANTTTAKCDLAFKAVSDHSRSNWPQEADLLRSGFVQQLYGLQGYRDMWFTGYAWGTPYSSTLWAFTDTVLERMTVDLKRE